MPLPWVLDLNDVSLRLDNGSHKLKYEHFTIAMHKTRRLALFTAANVDARPDKKKPEPNRDYSRRGLSGLGDNDREKWFVDPRVPPEHQLPDKFYTDDDTAFDKGHIVRRDAVTWGDSYAEVRRANGDTYHTTNCSPQVLGFNRANRGGLWGKLENIILGQADTERPERLRGTAAVGLRSQFPRAATTPAASGFLFLPSFGKSRSRVTETAFEPTPSYSSKTWLTSRSNSPCPRRGANA